MSEILPRWSMPEVNFIEHDPDTIKQEMIADYEAYTGITLAPGDPRRQFLLWFIDKVIQLNIAYNKGCQQTLLTYAQNEHLEAKGDFVQVTRLPASGAITTLRFTLSQALANAYTIPAGFQVTNGIVTFATDRELLIAPGELVGEVTATCIEPGVVGNGYLAGQISTIVSPMTFLISAANTTETSGGADEEKDPELAERIRLAPNKFSVAGPELAYVYHAYSGSSAIIDVAITSPTAGVVNVIPLLEGGEIPSSEILEKVEAQLLADTIRPLTDEVHAIAPTVREFEIVVDYWINDTDKTKSGAIQSAVQAAVENYRLWQQTKIGRDISPARLIHNVVEAGAARIDESTMMPAAFLALEADEVAQCTKVTINYKGYKAI